mmetsp:Transcript_22594/g.57616  ORF Transcript_22594/g.57616 Transcript_22594/m.57616 type:complete len:111 (-) Transcript_22594:46-378(-)
MLAGKMLIIIWTRPLASKAARQGCQREVRGIGFGRELLTHQGALGVSRLCHSPLGPLPPAPHPGLLLHKLRALGRQCQDQRKLRLWVLGCDLARQDSGRQAERPQQDVRA